MNRHLLRVLVLISPLLAPPTQAQTTAASAPERAIRPGELQDHLDEVRRSYPKLYDRLRRAPRVDAAQRASEPAALIPIEIRLKQTLRSNQPLSRGTP